MPIMAGYHCPVVPPRNPDAGTSPGYTRTVEYVDSSGNVGGFRTEEWLYNGTGGALVKGGVYIINNDGDEESNPRLLTVAAQGAGQLRRVAVAVSALADATWGWVCTGGYVDALVDGDTTDVAKDDYLKLVTATNADAFIQDSALSTDTFAQACAANATTETLTKINLLGYFADID